MENDRDNDELDTLEWIELETLQNEMLDEQASLARLGPRIVKFMTEAAFQEFPALKNMSADQIREFGEVVTRNSADFALKAANIAYWVEKRE